MNISFGNYERLVPAAVLLFLLLVPVLLEWRRRTSVLNNPWNRIHFSTSKIPTAWQRLGWWAGFVAATLLVIAAYANPQRTVEEWDRVFGRIRVTVILDISASVKKAEDIEPNRLVAAKEVILALAQMTERDEELKGKYEFALIPFSGAALPYYLPFTTSRDEFISHVESLDIEAITKRGTSLWAALRAYDELLLSNPPRDKKTVDLGILISDGGKEEAKQERALIPKLVADLRNPYRTAVYTLSGERIIVQKQEAQKNVVLYTVGVGKVEIDQEGNRVTKPVPLKNRDKAGNFMGYQHVNDQNPRSPVETSTLDERILKNLAELGGGEYSHFADRGTILRKFKSILLANRREVDRIPKHSHESMRAWFLVPSFFSFYFLFGYGGWIVRSGKKLFRFAYRLLTPNIAA